MNNVKVENCIISKDIEYKGNTILSYKIEYPQFESNRFQVITNIMNKYYRAKALIFQRYCERKLYSLALEQYEYSIKNNYPIMKFEAIIQYKITYNKDCILSLYFEQYIYTGGAHGITVRYADIWDLPATQVIELKNLFYEFIDYKNFIIKNIIEQIENQIKEGNDIYFEDYRHNVKNKFNPNNFYLNDSGIVIFFQQYDIAPYSSGIPEFLIPYSEKGVIRPKCI